MASFSLLITKAAFDQQDAYSAYRFVMAALKLKHEIKGIFFYQAGVHNGSAFQAGHSDELQLYPRWTALAGEHNIPLLVCVSAANRRGIINQQDAFELDKEHFNLSPPFTEVGLGDFVELMNVSQRVIQF